MAFDYTGFPQSTQDADAAILEEIKGLCSATAYPALTPVQLDIVLQSAKRADSFGTSLKSPAWIPTYHVNYAVAKAWELKAGNSANKSDYKDQDEAVSRSQVFAQCMEMAKMYRKKLTGSVKVLAPQRSSAVAIGIANIVPVTLPTEQEQENA